MWHPKIENNTEDWFYHEFQKRTSAKIIPQYEAPVKNSPYRLDFVIHGVNNLVGIEVDGSEYHDLKKDSVRDRRIINNYSDINSIIRFEAHDVYFNAPLVTIFICNHFPDLVFRYGGSLDRRFHTGMDFKSLRNEDGSSIENCIDKSLKDAYSYLKIREVHRVEPLTVKEEHGYKVYTYATYFIPPGKRSEYYNDQDKANQVLEEVWDYENQRFVHKPTEVNPLDYCVEKLSKISVMYNE